MMNKKQIALVACLAAIVMPLANMGLAVNIPLEKPQNAVDNYDVAYRMNPNTPGFVETGLKASVFDDPQWVPGAPDTIVHIDNEFVPNMHKEIWLLVDYINSDFNRDADITLLTADNATYAPTVDTSMDGTQLMFYWDLPNQPAWEEITFPSADYSNLTGDVVQWNLATICTPEPATLTLLCVGGLAVLKRRRKR